MQERYYSMTWRNKFLTTEAKTIGEMAEILEGAAEQLREMERAGVTLGDGAVDDYAQLETTDPEVAKKFGLRDWEAEYEEYEEGPEEPPQEDRVLPFPGPRA
jgi:hypothetical protein